MAGRGYRRWLRSAALATGVALLSPSGELHAQQTPTVAAQAAPIDPYAIPADVRPETPTETARIRSLSAAASDKAARGDYQAAALMWREVVAILEANWGPRHPVTAIGLNNLALSLNGEGRYADAEPLYRRALAIREARLGADHAETATALNNLAVNLEDQGRIADAETLKRRALAITEARLGADHPGTATILNNLALNLNIQGRFADAEPLLRRSLAIREARLGADHADTATGLNNLAESLRAQGRLADAEPLQRRALAITEARLGADHPSTATTLNNLALNLSAQGRPIEAEPLHRRALAIYETRLGPDHPQTAGSLNNLAKTLRELGRAADAEPLYRRALAINEARLGADHPAIARNLNNIAVSLDGQGRFADAEPLYRRALAVREARLGAEHPLTALTHTNLALTELSLSKAGMALTHARAALRVLERARTGADAAAAEATLSQLATNSRDAAATLVRAAWSVAAKQPAQASALRAEAFAAVQAMGMASSADALAQGAARVAAERAGAGPAVAAWRGAQDRLAAIDAQIAQAASLGAAGDARRASLGGERIRAVMQLAAAERDLATGFPRYFDLLKVVPLSVTDLQATSGDAARLLGIDEALVLLTPGVAWMSEGHRKGLVFVITKQTSAWAEIPLEASALAAEIAALHAMLAAPGAGATLAAAGVAPSVTYDRARAFALYRALFGAPQIAAALAGKDRWLIAPQGPLMSLPFAALPMAAPPGGAAGDVNPEALRASAWLGAERTLAILPSVSALRVQRLYPLAPTLTARAPFFGLGDPAFSGVADSDVRGGGRLGAARSYFRGGVADLTAFSRLPRLPETAHEIRALAASLGAGAETYVLQLDASETELRRRSADGRLARAEVVAFATHGLLAGEFDNAVAEPALALTPPTLPAGVPLSAENDGLLTASEAATLSLSSRFVILSACNTAAGGKPDADALSGLARAFLYAGAQSLLVSHYPVYDDAAMRLTTEAVRLARSQNLRNPEAMRASMRALLQDPSADAGGRSFAHPAAWAPFAVIDAN
ncbi:MAG: CHAT domain-containing tetratricopeptide repeat protein [Hyphomonadaceae bacterium]|nr:CHAT domain-containing tetratricopeptide repeat protein [Hyphomonadaceae bacterium]